ncbi:MAG: Gfo/Idh/MocA family oxidoreductase [Gemmatimonadota bacterium]
MTTFDSLAVRGRGTMPRRILIVGLGSIGTRHARVVRAVQPDAQIMALRHRGAEVPDGVAIDDCTTSLRDALAWRPDAAIIASPATAHMSSASALAAAGVHLLIEKPIAAESKDVGAMLAAARAAGVMVATGYNLRFLPSLIRFHAMLRRNLVGRVISVRAEAGQHLASWRPNTDWRRGVSANAALGGGVLLELSHELDYLRWIFGDVRELRSIIGFDGMPNLDVEDCALLAMQFAPGPLGQAVTASLAIDFVRHDRTRRCTVIGALGTLEWDAITGTIRHFPAAAEGWNTLFRSQPSRDATYDAQWRHFLERVMDGRTPCVTGEDGLAVLKLVEAVRHDALGARRARAANS